MRTFCKYRFALCAAALIHCVIGTEIEKRTAENGVLPADASISHQSAPGGCRFAGKKRFDILKNFLFQSFTAETELSGGIVPVDDVGTVVPFTIAAQSKIFRMRFAETLNKSEIGKPVSEREFQGTCSCLKH